MEKNMKKDYELNPSAPGLIQYPGEERTPKELIIDYLENKIKVKNYEILDEHQYGTTKHITQFHVKYNDFIDEIDVIEL